MLHLILHFFTGTMAFRIPRTSRRRNDAEIPDAFFISSSIRKNQNAGKAAKNVHYARLMQDCTAKQNVTQTRLKTAAKICRERNGFWGTALGSRGKSGR